LVSVWLVSSSKELKEYCKLHVVGIRSFGFILKGIERKNYLFQSLNSAIDLFHPQRNWKSITRNCMQKYWIFSFILKGIESCSPVNVLEVDELRFHPQRNWKGPYWYAASSCFSPSCFILKGIERNGDRVGTEGESGIVSSSKELKDY